MKQKLKNIPSYVYFMIIILTIVILYLIYNYVNNGTDTNKRLSDEAPAAVQDLKNENNNF